MTTLTEQRIQYLYDTGAAVLAEATDAFLQGDTEGLDERVRIAQGYRDAADAYKESMQCVELSNAATTFVNASNYFASAAAQRHTMLKLKAEGEPLTRLYDREAAAERDEVSARYYMATAQHYRQVEADYHKKAEASDRAALEQVKK